MCTQFQVNPLVDNQNSRLEKLDSSQTVSNDSIPVSEIQSETPRRSKPREWKSSSSFPHEFIIGDPSQGIRTRSSFKQGNLAFISQIEPKSINEALQDEAWLDAMKEELIQFDKNQVWKLVPRPQDSTIIGTRWVFCQKLDEHGKVVRNKARLVAQGFNQ